MDDTTYMGAALALATRGLGATWPNPSVGCVIVAGGRVVGRGRTGLRGRPHAETQALAMAGAAARGATAYVTLEPCSHHGHTPPCAEALVAAGIVRVVVAAGDPDPRVNGAGLALLRRAGLRVDEGFRAADAEDTLAGFFTRIRHGRPLVTLKLATTLDGRIATRTGESRWITGPEARAHVHALRGRHDAVMVGAATLAADDPDLTCRTPGYAHRPTVRIVADSRLRTPLTARIVQTAHESPSWILYHTDSLPDGVDPAAYQPGEIIPSRAQRLAEAGARCIPGARRRRPASTCRRRCARSARAASPACWWKAAAQLAAALLRADLVDRIVWFHAPGVMGADGLAALADLGTDALAAMPRFVRIAPPQALGSDVVTTFAR